MIKSKSELLFYLNFRPNAKNLNSELYKVAMDDLGSKKIVSFMISKTLNNYSSAIGVWKYIGMHACTYVNWKNI